MPVPDTILSIAVAAVSTRLRLKRGLPRGDDEAEAAHHRIEHMIAQPAKAPWLDLQGDMPVTEVIGGAGKQDGLSRFSSRDRFRRGPNLDDDILPIAQPITVAQRLTATRQQNPDRAAIVEMGAQPRA